MSKKISMKSDYIFGEFFSRKENEEYELIKGVKYYFIELQKFRKQKPDMNEKLNQ